MNEWPAWYEQTRQQWRNRGMTDEFIDDMFRANAERGDVTWLPKLPEFPPDVEDLKRRAKLGPYEMRPPKGTEALMAISLVAVFAILLFAIVWRP